MSNENNLEEYLAKLPDSAQYKGNAKKGEIELVTKPSMVLKILNILKERLTKVGLNANEAQVGIVFQDDRIVVVRDPVLFPSGALGTYIRIFERPALEGLAGAVVVPIRDDLVWLRWAFRHPTRTWELEFPRGYRSPGAGIEETALAELREELGFEVSELHNVGSVYSNTGILAGKVEVFVAILKEGEPLPEPESGEAFGEIVALSPGELRQIISEGRIRDCFTLSALQLASSCGFLEF